MRFGERIKQLRLEQNIGLREFCENVGVDPSNWSKIERGFAKFNTKDNLLLTSILVNLNIQERTQLYNDIVLLSYVDNIDRDKLFNEDLLVRCLPFCLSIDGQKPNTRQMESLIELLKNDIDKMRSEANNE